jgi:hypothetical protein
MDKQGDSWTIPLREAMIEMWAELILIALLSRGVTQTAKRLWVKQSHWISDTNAQAQREHNEEDVTDYAWRYLTGRSIMYAEYGISLPAPRHMRQRSLRFTHPALEP